MTFFDERIAKLQKEACMARKYNETKENEHEEIMEDENIKELTQEEVTLAIKNGFLEINKENLIFENKTCFHGKIILTIPKDFFDGYEEKYFGYCWAKKQIISILLAKTGTQDENIDGFLEKTKNFYKENDIYIEFISAKEERNENYNKYIISSRMPTALDYIYQYIIVINHENEQIALIFTCLEKDRKQWEKIIVGISELMEINGGDRENNE